MTLKTAYKNELAARQKFLIATEQSDGLRTDLAKKVWEDTQRELTTARMPPEALKTGLGGEIIPPTCLGMPGLENALKKADLLNAQATIERANLADKAGVFDLAFDAAESVSAKNSVEQMLAHQMAAAHRRAMLLIAESEASKDAEVAVKKARASARLLDAFSRSALTLQKLQSGGGQTIQVQYFHVNTTVGGVSENLQNPPLKNRGGRPPTTGDRTQASLAQRRADKELISTLDTFKPIT